MQGGTGAAGPPPGGLGGWKLPRKSRGSGGRQPPSKNNFKRQNKTQSKRMNAWPSYAKDVEEIIIVSKCICMPCMNDREALSGAPLSGRCNSSSRK